MSAVESATGIDAATEKLTPGGRTLDRSARTVAWLASDDPASATTRSPDLKSPMPGPTVSTTPAHSAPKGGASPGYAPSATSVSRKFSPAARTRTNSSPGPGARGVIDCTVTPSSPAPDWTTAFGPLGSAIARRRRGASTSSS